MTGKEAVYYIEHFEWNHIRLGLDRTRELLERVGNPQKQLKFVHVAGSNGKGSTCAMLSTILKAAGYKVGLYSSPHIEVFNERMQVNGENISDDDLGRITALVREEAEKMEDHPSQFELVTAVGFTYFLEQQCDIVVLEVGMGGEIDSTNIIDAPELAVITNIGIEHTEYLGNTIEEIARTKAGIIKRGSDVVCYDGDPVVSQIMKDTWEKQNAGFLPVEIKIEGHLPSQTPIMGNAEQVGCSEGICRRPFQGLIEPRFTQVDFSNLTSLGQSLFGQRFFYKTGEYYTRLLGEHQRKNSAVVLESVEALRRRGWKISDEAVRYGLQNVKWPARLEIMQEAPLFLLDGGHNPQCAQALMATVDELVGEKPIVFLMGILKDKDYEQVVDLILPRAKEFICLTPNSDRALAAEELAEYLRNKGAKARAFTGAWDYSMTTATVQKPIDTERDAVNAALEAAGEDGVVICFGSLYLAGEVRKVFH